ncbi:pyridoxal phosphate-dependent aminotransferase [Candidatus Micrarchaeota archaeon]|nr:pyridoxal phosphate-dependent aminotransferase [Candidatus Micrarchaeota archaeon]
MTLATGSDGTAGRTLVTKEPKEPRLTVVRPKELRLREDAFGIRVFPVADVNACAARVNGFEAKHKEGWKNRGGMISLSLGDANTGTMPDRVIDAHDNEFRAKRDVPYAPIPGQNDLREVVAANMKVVFGASDTSPKNVLPIPGSRFGELAFLNIFYTSPGFDGKSVLIIDPCWATGPQQALHLGGSKRLVEARLPYDPHTLFARFTPKMLEQILNDHPEIGGVFITNPDNPTSQLMSHDEMLGFARIIARRQLMALQDMTYGYVTFGHPVFSLERVAEELPSGEKTDLLGRLMTVLGLQKLVGSGLRVAAIASKNPSLVESAAGLLSYASGPVNRPAQAAAAAFYSDPAAIDVSNVELQNRRVALATALESARLRLHGRHGENVIEHTMGPVARDPNSTGGGYYAVMRLNPRATQRICERMDVGTIASDTVMEFFARDVGTKVQAGETMRLDDNYIRLAFGAAGVEKIAMLEDRLVTAFW